MSFKDKVITLAVVAGGFQAYNMYFRDHVQQAFVSSSGNSSEIKSNAFYCDGRQYCSQMTSREEAVFFIRRCPNTKMDGDNDGIPCEGDSRW